MRKSSLFEEMHETNAHLIMFTIYSHHHNHHRRRHHHRRRDHPPALLGQHHWFCRFGIWLDYSQGSTASTSFDQVSRHMQKLTDCLPACVMTASQKQVVPKNLIKYRRITSSTAYNGIVFV